VDPEPKKYVVVNAQGAATGSVWHIEQFCSQATMSDTRTVTEEEIRLLGFGQCRACQRHERLAAIDANVHLAEVLGQLGVDKLLRHELFNLANNVRKGLERRGVQLIHKDGQS
jgi:hypothetical protein